LSRHDRDPSAFGFPPALPDAIRPSGVTDVCTVPRFVVPVCCHLCVVCGRVRVRVTLTLTRTDLDPRHLMELQSKKSHERAVVCPSPIRFSCACPHPCMAALD
jgi:hypothetical protein